MSDKEFRVRNGLVVGNNVLVANVTSNTFTVSGSVGIGTSSPAYKLDIVNAGALATRLYNNASSSGDIQFQTQDTAKSFGYGQDASGGYIYGSGEIGRAHV